MTVKTQHSNVVSDFVLDAVATSASAAMRVPRLRKHVMNRLFNELEQSYENHTGDPDQLRHEKWFGRHLVPVVDRVIEERPASARAVIRFLATWASDIRRRNKYRKEGVVTPTTVVIEPTARCNFNCPGCYAKSTGKGADLSYEHLVQIVEEVIDMGVSLITISGGEPFLREKEDQVLTRLARRFDSRGFLVYTNGALIDEDTIDRMAEVGNIFPAISVEGYEHETDARRGSGVYRHTRKVRQMLRERGLMSGFSATVTRENCNSICTDDFLELRMQEGDVFGWFFLLQPIGRSPRTDLMITSEQRARLRRTVNRWRLENRPIFLGDFWNDGHLVGGCIAGGRAYFHIYADGNISPCVFSPVSCGNVMDIINGDSEYSSLDDLVQNNPVFRQYRTEQKKIKDRARPCLLIDHPEAFRRVAQLDACQPAKNMAPGYVDGEIAEAVDQIAEEWRKTVPQLEPIGADSEEGE